MADSTSPYAPIAVIPGPDTATFEAMAGDSIAALPKHFRRYLKDVVVQVQDFATPEQLASVNVSSPWHLMGLYSGHPLDKQSVWASGTLPARIYLFRQPLLARWHQSGASLEAVINNVVVHEVGHHFGLSDDDMHALEQQAR